MKNKVLIIVIILIVVVLLVGLLVPRMTKGKSGNNTENQTEMSSSEEPDSAIQESSEPQAEDSDKEEDEKADQGSEIANEDNPSYDSSVDEESGNDASSTGNPDDNASQQGSDKQSSGKSTSDISEISFPYTISGTDLVVEQIRSYSGYFIEDGSDKDISGVAAIVLKNNGDDLEFAGIGISQGTRSLGFSAAQIPAGATVIILEQNGASFSSSDPYYSATATTRPVDAFEMSEDLVTVKDNGNNGLTVTNISDKSLSEIKIFYKNYLEDEDVFVGGIAYTITLNDLEPGEGTDVSASHYASKYSKVMEVHAEQ